MAALKISDLSVGDWVSFEMAILKIEGDDIATAFVKKVQQPARIKSILGDQDLISAEVETEDDFGTMYLKMEHIRPIPITAEILEKNGFEFEKASRWHICELEDKTKINVWIGRNNEGRIEVSKPDIFEGGYHFKYADIEVLNIAVHQLQHALRLAGVDKEINL